MSLAAMIVGASPGVFTPYKFKVPPRAEVACKFAPGSIVCLNDRGEVAFNVPDRSPKAIREQIRTVARQLKASGIDEQEEAQHTLIDGVYTRMMFIPKGQVLIGQVHKKECVNIVAKGDITVLTEHGQARVKSGYIGVSKPGIQKIGYAHEDTIFINVFRTDKTDISEIEAEIATEDDSEETRLMLQGD